MPSVDFAACLAVLPLAVPTVDGYSIARGTDAQRRATWMPDAMRLEGCGRKLLIYTDLDAHAGLVLPKRRIINCGIRLADTIFSGIK